MKNEYYVRFNVFQNGEVKMQFRGVEEDELRWEQKFDIYRAPETINSFKFPKKMADAIKKLKDVIGEEDE